MLQEYEIPGEMRRFHTELPVSSYGRFRGKVYGRGKYRGLSIRSVRQESVRCVFSIIRRRA